MSIHLVPDKGLTLHYSKKYVINIMILRSRAPKKSMALKRMYKTSFYNKNFQCKICVILRAINIYMCNYSVIEIIYSHSVFGQVGFH